jgi:predicted DCC family thiol-disulfide oxidoreductase YuxK
MPRVSKYQIAIIRIIVGTYLFIYSGSLMFLAEIYRGDSALRTSMISQPQVLLTQLVLALMLLVSLVFIFGKWTRLSSGLLWLGWVYVFNTNNLLITPGLGFVGWLLLVFLIIDSTEDLPREIYFGGLVILGFGYLIDGYLKWESVSWAEGSALTHLLNSPYARDSILCDLLLALPRSFLSLLGWVYMFAELVFLPMIIAPMSRRYIWFIMTFLQLGLILLFDISSGLFGVLALHLLVFDSKWIPGKYFGAKRPLVFFDGVCTLCNGFVEFLICEDLGATFRFGSLQGSSAKAEIPKQYTEFENSAGPLTVVVKAGAQVYEKSDAALVIFSALGGYWRLFVVLKIIPKTLRDWIYDIISRNRYQWFGRSEVCRIPDPEQKWRFLD